MYIETKELQKYIHERTIESCSKGGNYYDKRGTISQEIFAKILKGEHIINYNEEAKIKNIILNYLNISFDEIKEIYWKDSHIKSLLNDYKTDLLIVLKDNTYKKISLKCSNKDNVGGLETNSGKICKELNINNPNTYMCIKKFQDEGCAPTLFKEKNNDSYNIIKNTFFEKRNSLVEYVLRGYTDTKKGADYICFISMQYNLMFFGTLDEYKKSIEKLKIKTTFDSNLIITRASKTREMKFKLINIANIYGKLLKMEKQNYIPDDNTQTKKLPKNHIKGQLSFDFLTGKIIE